MYSIKPIDEWGANLGINRFITTSERVCDICGCPYMGRLLTFDRMFTPVYDGDYVRLKKQVAGGIEIRDYNICPFCATDFRNFIESKKEKKDGF